MRLRTIGLISTLALRLLAAPLPAEAQQAKKMARIGYLSPRCGPAGTYGAFKEGLRELGWVEGKNVKLQRRCAKGQHYKLSDLATELVRLKVDLIVTGPGPRAARAAKGATATIPIVMVAVVLPVSRGLVASLARPGANVTGLALEVTPEQAGKNLELLKEAVPRVSRVAMLRRTNVPGHWHLAYSKEVERAAKTLGVTIQFAEVQAPNDKELEEALGVVVQGRANALLIPPSSTFVTRRQQIIDFAARNKLPAIYFARVFVNAGGLMSYGANVFDLFRRAAIYVDKILKGAKPANLPVERPTKFELIINLKTAKKLGLTIPPSILYRADEVIK